MTITLTCAVVYLCVGAGAQALLHARPYAARTVSRISGAVLVVLGAALLIENATT